MDLWAPLLAVARAADREGRGDHAAKRDGRAGERAAKLLATAHDLSASRDAEGESGPTALLVDALEAIRAARGERVTPPDLLAALASRPGWGAVKTPRRLASLLSPLGLTCRQVRDGERRRWCYILDAAHLADLRARYGGG